MISSFVRALIAAFKARRELALDNVALRQQLAVLRRSVKRPRLSNVDRRSWVTVEPKGCAFYLFIRVMEITDILSQNVPLEDVQYLAGHSNPSGHTVL